MSAILLLCRADAPAVDPVPGFLREPPLVVLGDADDERAVVLIEIRIETLPNTLGIKASADQPSRSQIVPPLSTTLDGLIEIRLVLTRLLQVVVDGIDHQLIFPCS